MKKFFVGKKFPSKFPLLAGKTNISSFSDLTKIFPLPEILQARNTLPIKKNLYE